MLPGLQAIDGALIARLLEEARRSPRRRVNYNFHRTPAEDPNRFLNVMLEGTYVAPHRHLAVPKPELFVVLEGRIVLFVFDDEGRVRERLPAGAGAPEGRVGVDVAAGIWHSLAVDGPYAVVCEVKPGGYDPATDKQFAPWAPARATRARRSTLQPYWPGFHHAGPEVTRDKILACKRMRRSRSTLGRMCGACWTSPRRNFGAGNAKGWSLPPKPSAFPT